MSSTTSSIFLQGHNLLQRQRDRLQSERVASNDDDDIVDADEEGSFVNSIHADDDEDEEGNTADQTQQQHRERFTLTELEEEREMARRRSSACVLFALFVLFRLWVEALNQGDVVLLLVCLAGTRYVHTTTTHSFNCLPPSHAFSFLYFFFSVLVGLSAGSATIAIKKPNSTAASPNTWPTALHLRTAMLPWAAKICACFPFKPNWHWPFSNHNDK